MAKAFARREPRVGREGTDEEGTSSTPFQLVSPLLDVDNKKLGGEV